MRLRLPVGAFERGIDTSVIDEETGEYNVSGERGKISADTRVLDEF